MLFTYETPARFKSTDPKVKRIKKNKKKENTFYFVIELFNI